MNENMDSEESLGIAVNTVISENQSEWKVPLTKFTQVRHETKNYEEPDVDVAREPSQLHINNAGGEVLIQVRGPSSRLKHGYYEGQALW